MTLSQLRRWTARARAFLRADRDETDVNREIAAHLALLEDAFRAKGLADDAARRAALHALGGVDQARELHRDARSIPWLEDLRQDLGHAWRGLASVPGFATAAVLTLAIGIGATTTMSAIGNALVLKPLAFASQAERLVRLVGYAPNAANPSGPPLRRDVSLTEVEVKMLESRAGSLAGAGIVSQTVMSVSGVEGAGRLSGAYLSASALTLLDASATLGRRLTDADAAAGHAVVVLSDRAWKRYFGGDVGIIGRTLPFETVLGTRRTVPMEVVGIMSAGFSFPTAQTEFWMLPPAALRSPFRGRLLARLAPGIEPEAAGTEVGEIVRSIRQLGPDVRFELAREQDELVAAVRPTVVGLLAAVAVLLCIACVNVASLFHARALAREREFATRAALGANRSRLVRQCLTESALVGAWGGAVGLGLSLLALALFRGLGVAAGRVDLAGPASLPRLDEVGLPVPVMIGTALTSILVGAAVGLLAAIRASRADAFAAVRQRAGTGTWQGRRLLATIQVAGAMTLLVGALLVGQTLRNLLAVEPGYESQHRLTFQVTLPSTRYGDAEVAEFAGALVERLNGLPGLSAAAYANQLPFVQLRDTGGGLWTWPDATRAAAPDSADARFVSRDYLATMGISILRGRGFEERDGAAQPRVVLVNQALVDRQFDGRDPLGLQVFIGRDVVPWTIVGVVANVRQFRLREPPEPQFFVDLRQWAPGSAPRFPLGPYFVAAARGNSDEALASVRAAVTSLDAAARLFNVASMDALVALSVAEPRLAAAVVGLFAVLAVLLAAVGLYGVLVFLVTQRQPEFGVRMALGAAARDVVRMIARQGAEVVVLGVAVGAVGALALSRVIESLLFGVTTRDPSAYLAAGAVLAGAAVLAIGLPARRATRVNPADVLRCE